ncbi:MotA/TolQ/ExbB proton channel [Hyphomicrobium denitrificans ATCC 51888]|uniref:MotA/TolQ/ExbB proton channel n=1 Tax=Hyphomicrobium denitrificans (strain ATCC 51888 / DSM 1869 / NCIMB 11706 / TK 0415) TaxID=582899 RepID=D8JQV5_HYPDA|nr:MotA/TolQ/ExbB proton channel family protein [Hyphomicrobium denitrificans]ADJ22107.1 MotA/TolQ/ExbB proton channel [Hyphomicrobium denitrificans ATCC 51888]
MTVLYLLAEEIAGRDLTILGLFQHADVVVKCIIVGLLSASVVCWAMTFEKLIRVWLVNREIKQLEKSSQTGTLPAAKSSGLIRAIIDAARTEWTEGAHDGSTGEVRDRLEIAMRSATKRQLKGIEQGLPFLATLGSAAPFIGLFGTVWGIMNSFTAIAQSKDTSLAVVAPGIAEALFATAVGLAAAIPAVIFYNQITVALGRAADRAAPAIVGLARSLSRSGVEGTN